MELTQKEKELQKLGIEKGYLTIQDFCNFFSKNYFQSKINKFLSLGLMEVSVGDKFIFKKNE